MITKEALNALPLKGRVEYLKQGKWVPAGANLSGANLTWADLSGADLSEAKLIGANLSRADLFKADLSGANLSGADLSGAKLSRANLSGADLSGANLSGANLSRADLSGVKLSGADLSGANLARADLSGAKLSNTHLDPVRQEAHRKAALAAGEEGLVFYRTKHSQHCGDTEYVPGETYTAPWFSMDGKTACHPGIYGGTLGQIGKQYPHETLVKCHVDAGDYITCSKGIRCKRMRVLEGV